MVKIEELRKFVSGDFTSAVLSTERKGNKIELNLNLVNRNKIKNNFMHMYNTNLERLTNTPKELVSYMLEKYLENSTILGAAYFVTEQSEKNKLSFIMNGAYNHLKIEFSNNCMELLPCNLFEKIETAKKEGILKTINNVDIKKIVLSNFDKNNIGRDYKTGLRSDTMDDSKYYYESLRIQDKSGDPISYEGEKDFVFKLLETLVEKGDVNYDLLRTYDDMFKFGYYNKNIDYMINDKICINCNTNSDLMVFAEFLDKYLNKFKDEIKDNQMKLVLKRKGE